MGGTLGIESIVPPPDREAHHGRRLEIGLDEAVALEAAGTRAGGTDTHPAPAPPPAQPTTAVTHVDDIPGAIRRGALAVVARLRRASGR